MNYIHYQVSLNLSDCVQVSNAVIRNILMGCSSLREICLDRCLRVTDAAFDPNMSPFDPLRGCYSLENISLQVLLTYVILLASLAYQFDEGMQPSHGKAY